MCTTAKRNSDSQQIFRSWNCINMNFSDMTPKTHETFFIILSNFSGIEFLYTKSYSIALISNDYPCMQQTPLAVDQQRNRPIYVKSFQPPVDTPTCTLQINQRKMWDSRHYSLCIQIESIRQTIIIILLAPFGKS